jgi:hypothetical protein
MRKLANNAFLAGTFNISVSWAATPQHRGGAIVHAFRRIGYSNTQTRWTAAQIHQSGGKLL